MSHAFRGVYSVLPTPFLPSESIDWSCLERVVALFIAAGVDGLTALGVTSEVTRLSDAECDEVLVAVLRHVDGRVPVIAGATAEATSVAIDRARRARDRGAAGVMIGGPRMLRMHPDIVLRHFAAIAAAVELPIVVQDYPVVSGYAMSPELLARITREVPLATTVKLEDPPTPPKVAAIRRVAADTDVHILGGLGGMFLLEELMAGARGTMTGFAYPEVIVRIVRAFSAGRVDEATDIANRYAALFRFEAQEGVGMAVRKEVLKRRGALDHASLRTPGVPLDDTTARALDHLLAWYGLRDARGEMRWTSD